MAAKCNITSLALKKLNQLYWGFKPDSDISSAVIENYIEYLDCKDVKIANCYEVECKNDPIVVTCQLAISSIQSTINQNVVTFSIPSDGITNGTAPYTYKWVYETDDFDNSGPIDVSTSVLTVKPTKKVDYLVTNIQVTVTDAKGCTATKSCWLTPTGMQCTENYVACLTNSFLTVTNKVVVCGALSSLVVTKKI